MFSHYVIVRYDGAFWSGSKWVYEYPSAKVYNYENQVIDAVDTLLKRGMKGQCDIVENYGSDNEISLGLDFFG